MLFQLPLALASGTDAAARGFSQISDLIFPFGFSPNAAKAKRMIDFF